MASGIFIKINSKVFVQKHNINETHEAIRNLHFSIPKGQFCSIVGPSGCGKTTLLNLIAGLDKEVKGKILFENNKKLEDIKTAYMFQTPRLLPWLNVIENVEVTLNKEQKLNNRAAEILNIMGLEKFYYYYPNQLSGGMQRRVALARSYSSQPELFLLDEPFVSLDDVMANKLRDMLIKLWMSEPTTIVFVTHDIREAIYLSDRIIFLSKPPSSVILDKKINLKRPRCIKDKKIEKIKEDILSDTQYSSLGEVNNA